MNQIEQPLGQKWILWNKIGYIKPNVKYFNDELSGSQKFREIYKAALDPSSFPVFNENVIPDEDDDVDSFF